MSSSEHGGVWANPAPAGLTALAVACFGFFSVLTGKVPHSVLPLLGCWLIGGFVVQMVVGVIELRQGAILGGNVFLFFSAFFMLVGGLEFIIRTSPAWAAANPSNAVDGWAWLVLTITTILWTPAYMKTAPSTLSLLVISLDIGIVFFTLMELGLIAAAIGATYAGWFLLIAGILGIYIAAGIQLNTAFGKTIFPLGGPMLK
ncbi:MAG: hypothetical protein CVU90_08385 [Firmicutes bacterium HGW-Firmicutes-15]|nr:MAG: hypothetical protein CVU90_08385 [Firmicutes bacterium HGW-Firmicutes-15]